MSLFHSLQRYWHTISPLRLEQIGGQLWMRMRPLRRRFPSFPRSTEPYPGCRLSREKSWLPPPSGSNESDAIRQGQLSFVRESHDIGWPPAWDVSEPSKLWQYNLFYFEWLWSLSVEDASAVVQDWISYAKANPFHTGMDPYPTSLRLMNWCGVFFHKYRDFTEEALIFREQLWQSLCEQVDHLRSHLEYHLMGNHLFENAVALALLGSSFEGERAQQWCKQGLSLLEREIQEQILPDGLHFELSPMYHLRILYTLLLLEQHGDSSVRRVVSPHLPRMLEALLKVCHPDRQIALLNDSGFEIYHRPEQLLAWRESWENSQQDPESSSLGEEGVWSLPYAGYYGARSREGHYLICDAGPPGPDYIPGHAHGDIFSFELSLHGQRVVVDSGVYDYVNSDWRRYCRSTKAHNTLTIDALDQSEFWGAFRVARRGRPHDVTWRETEEGFVLQGWHDGYLRLPKKQARHERSFRWSQTGRLEVHDTVQAAQPVCVASRLHLHPACTILSQTSHRASLSSPVGDIQILFEGPGELLPPGTEESWYCPTLGCAQANDLLIFQATGTHIRMSFLIE